MLAFLAGCCGLFSSTLNMVNGQEFFRLLSAVLIFQMLLGLFLMLYRGTKKM